jgi:hypothetical protein
MIIFDLDGTLADCEHRRHFVDKEYIQPCNHWHQIPNHPVDVCDKCKSRFRSWKPDWRSFFDSCNEDTPIWPVVRVIESLGLNEVTIPNKEIQIWSGRCESVRDRTAHWLKYIIGQSTYSALKMRPIGDSTPDDVLKEKWLDETLKEGKTIEFVFDDRPKVVRMWRRRGIFVFNCYQREDQEEF